MLELLILPPVLGVHRGQVPRAREQVLLGSLGLIRRRVMGLLPGRHRPVKLRRADLRPGLEPLRDVPEGAFEISKRRTRRCVAGEPEGEEGGHGPGPVGEHADPFAGQVIGGGDVGHEAPVQGRRVHVAHVGGHQQTWLGLRLEHGQAEAHEGLLQVFVEVGVLQLDRVELLQPGEVVLLGVFVAADKVVDGHPGQGLLHELTERAVEEQGVERGQRRPLPGLGSLVAVQLVALVQGVQVALDAHRPVHHRVLGAHVGLVKVPAVLGVSGLQVSVQDRGRVPADEHGHGSGAAGRTGVAFGVHGDVGANGNGVPGSL